MMISPAANPYAAAAALDRQWRSPGAPDDAPSGSGPADGGPDVVVTLSQGASPPRSTYDASGRMPGAPSRDDQGAEAPGSMAQASESDGGGDTDASVDSTAAAASPDNAGSSTNVDEDAAAA